MKKSLAAFALILSLAACADDMKPPVQYTRTTESKIALDVRVISLADRSLTPGSNGYAGNNFSPTISEAVKQWASDRLQAVGQTGDAIVIIKDASLTAQPLATKTGMDSWFTRQQGLKYVGHVQVAVEAKSGDSFAVTDASATRTLTLPENPTDAEKRDAYATMLNGLMKDLERNLDSGIQSHLNRFITTMPTYGTTAVPAAATTDSAIMQQPVSAPIPLSGAGNM